MREQAQREIDAKLSRGMPKWSLPKGGTLEDRRAGRHSHAWVMTSLIQCSPTLDNADATLTAQRPRLRAL